MCVLWKHITPPPKKTAQTFLLTEGKRPSFAMVCWFARLALWSRVLWFCPCFLCSASILGRAVTSGPLHQLFLLGPCSPPDTCLASVLVCSGYHDRIPQTGQFKQQTFIFSQAWKTSTYQGLSQFDFWWELSAWYADNHLLAMSTHGLSSMQSHDLV